MLPRRLRLSRAQFAPATLGKRATSAHFSVTFRRIPGAGGCASIVSKKVARRSVDRHLLKRRIQSVLAPWCSPSHSLVIYARAGSLSLSFQELAVELTELLARAVGQKPVVR